MRKYRIGSNFPRLPLVFSMPMSVWRHEQKYYLPFLPIFPLELVVGLSLLKERYGD
jgi:hypothetical protein